MTESHTPMLDEIAARGNRGHHFPNHHDRSADIVCNDGTMISVVAGNGLNTDPYVLPCCDDVVPSSDEIPPKSVIVAHDYAGPYTAVEVFTKHRDFTEMLMGLDLGLEPQRWIAEVDVLREFILAHGGEFNPVVEAESIVASGR